MYSPKLNEKLVMTMYRMKHTFKMPITRIAEELIMQSLKAVDKDSVCKGCVIEQNNQCEQCLLNKEGAL